MVKSEKHKDDKRTKLNCTVLKTDQGKGESRHGEIKSGEIASNPKKMKGAESVMAPLDLGWLKFCLAWLSELFLRNEEAICGVCPKQY